MVNYVILIVIAVSLALLVYSFIAGYIPKFQTPECPEGINLIIQDYSCLSKSLAVDVTNKGLFNIDLAKVRLRDPGRKIKTEAEDEINFPPKSPEEPPGLAPGETYHRVLPQSVQDGTYNLEVQPIVFIEDKQALCPTVIQEVTCPTP